MPGGLQPMRAPRALLSLFAALLGAPLAAAAADLPAGLRLVDVTGAMSVEWALPAGHGAGCRLAVDPNGKPWLGCRDRFLLGPSYAAVYEADRPFDSLAWLSDGSLLAASGDELGSYPLAAAAVGSKAPLKFKKIRRFPGCSVSVFAGEGDTAYVVASGPSGTEVLLLSRGPTRWSDPPL